MQFSTLVAFKGPLSGMYAYKNAYGRQVPAASIRPSPPTVASPRYAGRHGRTPPLHVHRQLVQIAALPEGEHAAAPVQDAGVGQRCRPVALRRAQVCEPPQYASRVMLLLLHRRLHVPRGVVRHTVGAETEREEVTVAVERVHGGPMVTTSNIHFYDEQLSSLKEPNSS